MALAVAVAIPVAGSPGSGATLFGGGTRSAATVMPGFRESRVAGGAGGAAADELSPAAPVAGDTASLAASAPASTAAALARSDTPTERRATGRRPAAGGPTRSLRVRNAPVREVLRRVALLYGVSIAVSPDVTGRVSVAFDRLSLDEALGAVLAPLGAVWTRSHRVVVVMPAPGGGRASPTASPFPPAVLSLQLVRAARAAAVLRALYPHARIAIDSAANALVVMAAPDDVTGMRAVVQGIDVRDPLRPTTEAIQLHNADPRAVAEQIRGLYRDARVALGPNRTLLVDAQPGDLAQIKALLATIDTPAVSPSPSAAPVEAVRVTKASPRDVARAVANQFRDVRASVAGSSVLLGGPPDDVAKAKALVALVDQPQAGVRYTEVYRLRYVEARSVGELLARSFGDVRVSADANLNALSVFATGAEHQRIADAIAQLDTTSAGGGLPVQQPGTSAAAGGGEGSVEVVSLKAAAPGLNGAPSSSATDIATTVTQALQAQAPDLHITVPPNGTQLVLSGSPYALRLAKTLIDQLDVEQKLVVLDTEILEIDENASKNLGLSLTTPVLGTTFSETTPYAANGGTPPPFLAFQAVGRTPLSLALNLNLLIQSGKGRVLADPRITTISGRTATIRAGDNIAILTTTGGGTGTVATTQLQTFQTGVTLDITPVVNAGNYITVSLHPTVNSLSGISNGIPQISTRDTQTTVAMHEDETLVIGGLIQDTSTSSTAKIPLLGDLPLIGKAFRNDQISRQRNELVITVTPHIVTPGAPNASPGPPLPAGPTPAPLPTLPPNASLPPPRRGAATRSAGPQPWSTGAVAPSPSASIAPAPNGASPVPHPSPQPNAFTFGQAPASTFAGPNDPLRIFAATFAPTTVRNGTPVHFTAVTTTNVARLTVGYPGFETQIAQTSPGQWDSAYNFTAAGLGGGAGPAQLTVTASRLDGVTTSLKIPIVVVP
ncbi:MAG TPA: secretin N-terminal domain-containing protein [Candidatus Baltobacteraceae bacterium]|nr:secretin N-terminal domain-containing protein [Candidatus Baltobacteraceae bacterium]